MLNIIEKKVQTFVYQKDRDGLLQKVFKSPTEQHIKLLMESDEFVKSLPVVNRFMKFPLPFLDENNCFLVPESGYDSRLQAFFTADCPQIEFMGLENAKKKLDEALSGFLFQEEMDKIIARAYILTPACRGLFKRITCRTPLFLLMANRERAGKDYLGGVQGILYEGEAVEDTAFCTGEKGQQNNEELRKKITTSMLLGRRRLHSANNKGFINNAILEQFLTTENWTDRVLGRNQQVTLTNEMDVSLSANMGLSYTPDLWHRSRAINLFFAEEDPNAREFPIPDLHGYIKENRGEFLSATFTLLKSWIDSGQPEYKNVKFTSFPEWARVVGNVMVHHGLGNPTVELQSDSVGGDKATAEIKRLFENLYEQHGEAELSMKELIGIIAENQGGWQIFTSFDLTNAGDRAKLSKLIRKYIGRIFSEIKLEVDDSSKRADKQKLSFKNIQGGRGGLGGLISPAQAKNKEIKTWSNESKPPEPPKPPEEATVLNFIKENPECSFEDIYDYLGLESFDKTHHFLENLKSRGLIFELRPGVFRVVE